MRRPSFAPRRNELPPSAHPPAPAGDRTAAGARSHAGWRACARPALGTLVEISAPAPSDALLREWAAPAFARIDDFSRAMSFHSPASDVAAIARAPAGAVIDLRSDTWATLALALALEAASNGRFDCAVAPTLVDRGVLDAPAGALRPRARSAAALELLPDRQVRVVEPVWIDLGGIAKGAAVDAALRAMRDAGAPAGLVNAGGDLATFGDAARQVRVRDPRLPGATIRLALLQNGACATSGPYFEPRALVAPGGECPPATGSVSVFAATCAVADGLTKVLALDGLGAEPLLRLYDARGVVIDARGCAWHV